MEVLVVSGTCIRPELQVVSGSTDGILEYMGKFFLQNFNFELDIVDNVAKLPDYINEET